MAYLLAAPHPPILPSFFIQHDGEDSRHNRCRRNAVGRRGGVAWLRCIRYEKAPEKNRLAPAAVHVLDLPVSLPTASEHPWLIPTGYVSWIAPTLETQDSTIWNRTSSSMAFSTMTALRSSSPSTLPLRFPPTL